MSLFPTAVCAHHSGAELTENPNRCSGTPVPERCANFFLLFLVLVLSAVCRQLEFGSPPASAVVGGGGAGGGVG